MIELILKRGRDKPVRKRHPWIFSGAVAEIRGNPTPGETVAVKDAGGNFLAWAGYSPHSQIRARNWSWDLDDLIDPSFFAQKIEAAISRRSGMDLAESNGFRVIHAESDGLPGLIVDRYYETLVVQFLFAGIEYWRESVLAALQDVQRITRIYERSDSSARELEGLPKRKGLLNGPELEELTTIREHDLTYKVDIQNGHKTGYYLDQRQARRIVRSMAVGRDVLDCYCYSGSFAINAVKGMAKNVTALDASEEALGLAGENAALNSISPEKIDWVQGDVPSLLRRFRDANRKFDLIILDPPKFAATSAQVNRASRGYKDINLLAFKLLNMGGNLLTFSCSGGVSPDLFQKIVASAALDANVNAQILGRLHQGQDHPVSVYFPEGAYLKGLICRVI